MEDGRDRARRRSGSPSGPPPYSPDEVLSRHGLIDDAPPVPRGRAARRRAEEQRREAEERRRASDRAVPPPSQSGRP
ncbi:MAG: hypothetical protein L0H64_24590, partial [Pseudonocardia sp.]|nr:hypothetical protein [Pseudonocardia sp.]